MEPGFQTVTEHARAIARLVSDSTACAYDDMLAAGYPVTEKYWKRPTVYTPLRRPASELYGSERLYLSMQREVDAFLDAEKTSERPVAHSVHVPVCQGCVAIVLHRDSVSAQSPKSVEIHVLYQPDFQDARSDGIPVEPLLRRVHEFLSGIRGATALFATWHAIGAKRIKPISPEPQKTMWHGNQDAPAAYCDSCGAPPAIAPLSAVVYRGIPPFPMPRTGEALRHTDEARATYRCVCSPACTGAAFDRQTYPLYPQMTDLLQLIEGRPLTLPVNPLRYRPPEFGNKNNDDDDDDDDDDKSDEVDAWIHTVIVAPFGRAFQFARGYLRLIGHSPPVTMPVAPSGPIIYQSQRRDPASNAMYGVSRDAGLYDQSRTAFNRRCRVCRKVGRITKCGACGEGTFCSYKCLRYAWDHGHRERCEERRRQALGVNM